MVRPDGAEIDRLLQDSPPVWRAFCLLMNAMTNYYRFGGTIDGQPLPKGRFMQFVADEADFREEVSASRRAKLGGETFHPDTEEGARALVAERLAVFLETLEAAR
jgi:hypothetical protein